MEIGTEWESERSSCGPQQGGVLTGRTVFTGSIPQWLEDGVASNAGSPALSGRFGLTTPEVLSSSEMQHPGTV